MYQNLKYQYCTSNHTGTPSVLGFSETSILNSVLSRFLTGHQHIPPVSKQAKVAATVCGAALQTAAVVHRRPQGPGNVVKPDSSSHPAASREMMCTFGGFNLYNIYPLWSSDN